MKYIKAGLLLALTAGLGYWFWDGKEQERPGSQVADGADRDAASRSGSGAGGAARGPASTEAEEDRSAALEQSHLQQRIGGLTSAALVETVLAADESGTAIDHNRFLWRATGLLRSDPEACRALLGVYQQAGLSTGKKELIADLLAHAGSPAAQEALVSALSAPVTAADAGALPLWQRLAFVRTPTAGTLEAALARYTESSGEDRLSLLQTLGALAAGAESAGNPLGAARLTARLDEVLQTATDSRERTAVIAAIGNARRPRDIEMLSSIAAGEGDPDVRDAAIRALGRQGAKPEARDALAGLLKGEQLEASTGALVIRGLSRGGALRDGDMDAMTGFASDRELESDLAGEMSRALSLQYRERTGDSWRGAMEVVAAKSQGAPAIQAQGMLLLDSLKTTQ